jgi:homocysteine S-methyltransferase
MRITDGGMETTLIFKQGLDLPHFAAFVLLDDPDGLEALRAYYRSYIEIAQNRDVGIVLDTPTWRANADWGQKLGYGPEALADVNRRSVSLLEELRTPEVQISGCIGPRGDGYQADAQMSAAEAQRYHATQAETFAGTTADLIIALTLTYAEEAIGIVRAAQDVPVVISFTVETDGRLPSGQALGEAIQEMDGETDEAAAYFMVNCAHPTHFADVLEPGP